MKRYIGTCLPHAGRYMQSRTGSARSRYTGFYIAAVLFLLLQDFLLRPVLNFSPRGTRAFTVFSLFCNEKIAAPRRTRVTNSTKICRTSLVARYAAPPCVTRYAATYIASTVVRLRRIHVGHSVRGSRRALKRSLVGNMLCIGRKTFHGSFCCGPFVYFGLFCVLL